VLGDPGVPLSSIFSNGSVYVSLMFLGGSQPLHNVQSLPVALSKTLLDVLPFLRHSFCVAVTTVYSRI
jgi:hypothetical protein